MIKPLRSNVVLSPTEHAEEHRIGIIIASSVSNEGRVVAIGQDVKELKLGDIVRYDSQAAVKLDQYLMCREADVLCVVE
jgi:co-chaperonin GroES (HSP10)